MADILLPVAIIGGSGFIGGAIAKALTANGRCATVLDVRPPLPGAPIGTFSAFDLESQATWPDDWSAYSAIIIAAGYLDKAAIREPRRAYAVNVTSTVRLIEAIADSNPTPRIVFLSSGMVYDDERATPPFVERDPVRPTSLYTASKICTESALSAAAAGGLVRALVLRPFTVFGPGRLDAERGHLFGRWLDLCANGQPLSIYGDGTQSIDPVGVGVLASACVAYLSIQNPAPYMVVNVTSGQTVSLRRLAELFVETGIARKFVLQPEKAADTRRGWGYDGELRSLIGTAFKDDVETEIKNFLNSFRAIAP